MKSVESISPIEWFIRVDTGVLIALVFLKVLGAIRWPWEIVLAPLWAPPVFLAIFIAVVSLITAIADEMRWR